ncbi:MAG: COX15/CtaA family protein [Planctomycetota bacterium]|jgi:cytochrome c oxidase assembly protein subunit 15
MNGEQAIAPGSTPGAMAFPDRPGAAPGRIDPRDEAPPVVSNARRRASAFLVAATLFLIFAGAEVKSRQAGLAVPDWPLSFGMLWPPMVGNVYYEHGHRTIAAAVGLCTLLLMVWTLRTERRAWVRRLSVGTLAAVVAQGVLGGLTVLFLLPPPVSIGHALLAQTFLCLVAWQAWAVSREARAGTSPGPPARAAVQGTGHREGRALRAAVWAAGAVYVQLFLGALMRHTESGLAVPFFPLSEDGGLLPEAVTAKVWIHMAHRGFALVVVALVLTATWRVARALPRLARHAAGTAALVLVQVALGATVIWTAGRDMADGVTPVVAPLPASLHVVTGAALLVSAWLLVLRVRGARRTGQRTPSRAMLAPEGTA